MRIISGDLKRQRILPPEDKSTRPLRDLVKESIFNLLEHSRKIKIKLENSEVLDLFSGSGSFGLECISRGSNTITPIFDDETLIPTRANSRQSRLEITIEQTPDFSRLYIEDNVSPLHQPLFVCSICLDDSNENVKTLLCGHKFHKDCIEEWLNREESCPMCRIEFNL